MVNPFLVGQRVYLRPFQRADAPVLVRFMNDPAVRRALLLERPITLEEEEEFLVRLGGNKEMVLLGVVARDGDRLVGSITDRSEQLVLGASNPVFVSKAQWKQIDDPARNPVIWQRVDADWDCARLATERATIFPPKPLADW